MISAKEARDIYNKSLKRTSPFDIVEREIRAKSENGENQIIIDDFTFLGDEKELKDLLYLLNKKGFKITKSLFDDSTYYVEW